jgi:hypothetical protein
MRTSALRLAATIAMTLLVQRTVVARSLHDPLLDHLVGTWVLRGDIAHIGWDPDLIRVNSSHSQTSNSLGSEVSIPALTQFQLRDFLRCVCLATTVRILRRNRATV